MTIVGRDLYLLLLSRRRRRRQTPPLFFLVPMDGFYLSVSVYFVLPDYLFYLFFLLFLFHIHKSPPPASMDCMSVRKIVHIQRPTPHATSAERQKWRKDPSFVLPLSKTPCDLLLRSHFKVSHPHLMRITPVTHSFINPFLCSQIPSLDE